ncbi:WD40/YVTN/BNR-like repeat-containing protein [Paenibacillus sp. S-38]|uniref:WD40/YVTN/BNR-like repeat-containing protein n=1 Tax=Paenibacillus sp. S-38 TaxID=3416710 RepID=UPI003CEC1A99
MQNDTTATSRARRLLSAGSRLPRGRLRQGRTHLRFTLPLLLLVLAGCTQTAGMTPDSTAVPPPKTPDSTAVTPPKTPDTPSAAGGAKAPAGEPAPEGQRRIQARLTGFHALDGQTAYVWGLSSGRQLRLYKTADGGSTWIEASSPLAAESKADPGPEAFQVLDREHLVYTSAGHSLPAAIAISADGGKSWKSGALPEEAYGGETVFTSKQHGFLVVQPDAAMGSSHKRVYETGDGGQTWALVMDNSVLTQKLSEAAGVLPLAGFANRGIAFRGERDGWLPLESRAPGKVTLFRTTDKARTWHEVPLEVSSKDVQGQPQISAPVFWSGGEGAGWMPYEFWHEDIVSLGAYFTSDGGETWKLKAFGPETDVLSAIGSTGLTFQSAREGWMWNGAHLLHTSDGGSTWEPLAGNRVWEDTLKSFPELMELQFVTPESGWALVRSAKADASRLLKTEDGGKNWIVL